MKNAVTKAIIEVPGITPLNTSIMFTAFEVTAMAIGIRIGYTIVSLLMPIKGR